MPMCYTTATKAVADTFSTSGSAGVEVDSVFIKPGARNVGITLMQVLGRGAGLTALSGIAFRLKLWPTTASSGGTAITPTPKDPGMQAATATAGGASGGVTSGTTTAVIKATAGCGAAGPGGWAARDADSVLLMQGSATQSTDLFVASGTASLAYEASIEHQE